MMVTGLALLCLFTTADALFKRVSSGEPCVAYAPFKCPDGTCIPLDYVCDNNVDCGDGYDETATMCTAAKRMPVEEMDNWLGAFLRAHGPNSLVGLFGPKAADKFKGYGGVRNFAIGLSEMKTLANFGRHFKLNEDEINFIETELRAISGDVSEFPEKQRLRSSELSMLRDNIVERLLETGFLDY